MRAMNFINLFRLALRRSRSLIAAVMSSISSFLLIIRTNSRRLAASSTFTQSSPCGQLLDHCFQIDGVSLPLHICGAEPLRPGLSFPHVLYGLLGQYLRHIAL